MPGRARRPGRACSDALLSSVCCAREVPSGQTAGLRELPRLRWLPEGRRWSRVVGDAAPGVFSLPVRGPGTAAGRPRGRRPATAESRAVLQPMEGPTAPHFSGRRCSGHRRSREKQQTVHRCRRRRRFCSYSAPGCRGQRVRYAELGRQQAWQEPAFQWAHARDSPGPFRFGTAAGRGCPQPAHTSQPRPRRRPVIRAQPRRTAALHPAPAPQQQPAPCPRTHRGGHSSSARNCCLVTQ